MADEIKYQINVQMMDNTVTVDDPDDKIFTVVSNGTADKERLIAEMQAVNPGLEVETLRMVLDLENRIIKKLLLSGMRVNNGLFEAAIQCRGVVHGTAWDPEVNSLYINLSQGKDLREALANTTVNVVGEKGATMYFSTGGEAASRAGGFTATAGRPFTLTGRNIKVEGDDPSVGITLTDKAKAVTTIDPAMIALNQPSKLIFIIPSGLEDGEYTLTVTTQYTSGDFKLKSPRSASCRLVIGAGSSTTDPDDDGDDDSDDGHEEL